MENENIDLKDLFIKMDLQEVGIFRMHLDRETDRGCALMSAAFLDEKLKELLQQYMVQDTQSLKELFSGNGAISSFSSRIELSYLLGLISKNVRKDLNLIRKIRNEFAHSIEIIDFDHPKISGRILELQSGFFKDKQLSMRKIYNRMAFYIAGIVTGSKMKIQSKEEAQNNPISSVYNRNNKVFESAEFKALVLNLHNDSQSESEAIEKFIAIMSNNYDFENEQKE